MYCVFFCVLFVWSRRARALGAAHEVSPSAWGGVLVVAPLGTWSGYLGVCVRECVRFVFLLHVSSFGYLSCKVVHDFISSVYWFSRRSCFASFDLFSDRTAARAQVP